MLHNLGIGTKVWFEVWLSEVLFSFFFHYPLEWTVDKVLMRMRLDHQTDADPHYEYERCAAL